MGGGASTKMFHRKPPFPNLKKMTGADSCRCFLKRIDVGVSKNSGTPKSSIVMGVSIINHPFCGFSRYFWKHPNGFDMIIIYSFFAFSWDCKMMFFGATL